MGVGTEQAKRQTEIPIGFLRRRKLSLNGNGASLQIPSLKPKNAHIYLGVRPSGGITKSVNLCLINICRRQSPGQIHQAANAQSIFRHYKTRKRVGRLGFSELAHSKELVPLMQVDDEADGGLEVVHQSAGRLRW